MVRSERASLSPKEETRRRRTVHHLYLIHPEHPDQPQPREPRPVSPATQVILAKPRGDTWQYPTVPRNWPTFIAWEYHQWTPVPTGVEGLRLLLLGPGLWDEQQILTALKVHQPTLRAVWPLATGVGSHHLLRRLGPIQWTPERRGEPLRVLWSKSDVDYILNPTPDTPLDPQELATWTIWDLKARSDETATSYRLFVAAPPNREASWVIRAVARQLMQRDTTRWWWDMINQDRTTLMPLHHAQYDATATERLVAWLPIPGFHLIFTEKIRKISTANRGG